MTNGHFRQCSKCQISGQFQMAKLNVGLQLSGKFQGNLINFGCQFWMVYITYYVLNVLNSKQYICKVFKATFRVYLPRQLALNIWIIWSLTDWENFESWNYLNAPSYTHLNTKLQNMNIESIFNRYKRS